MQEGTMHAAVETVMPDQTEDIEYTFYMETFLNLESAQIYAKALSDALEHYARIKINEVQIKDNVQYNLEMYDVSVNVTVNDSLSCEEGCKGVMKTLVVHHLIEKSCVSN